MSGVNPTIKPFVPPPRHQHHTGQYASCQGSRTWSSFSAQTLAIPGLLLISSQENAANARLTTANQVPSPRCHT